VKDSRRSGVLSLSRRALLTFFVSKTLEETMFSRKSPLTSDLNNLKLEKLTGQQVEQIDELVSSLEEQGEVRLIVQRGVLKYINKVEKYKSWKTDDQDLIE
jgi:hypothetical protein